MVATVSEGKPLPLRAIRVSNDIATHGALSPLPLSPARALKAGQISDGPPRPFGATGVSKTNVSTVPSSRCCDAFKHMATAGAAPPPFELVNANVGSPGIGIDEPGRVTCCG